MTSTMQFYDEDFNAVTWVNRTLAESTKAASDTSRPPETTSMASSPSQATGVQHDDRDRFLDQELIRLQTTLEDAAREAHGELDAALARALSAAPWSVREIAKFRQRAEGLRSGVDGVGERVAGVETAVSTAVAAIADADMIVRHVEGAREMLAKAAHADALLERLDSLLTSSSADGSDLVSAADVVAELRAALEPLRAVKDLKQRFDRLDSADEKLEKLAAPRLKEALESRNAQAAANARIVFDRAGRDNAFVTQYVSIRAAETAEMWTAAWRILTNPKPSIDDASGTMKRSTTAEALPNPPASQSPAQTSFPDLASTEAAMRLDGFLNQFTEFLRLEASWLATAFPDLRARLLPSLIASALAEPREPSVAQLRPNLAKASASSTNRMYNAALRSTRASADIAQLLRDAVADSSDESDAAESMQELGELVNEALTAITFPGRLFWELWPALAARAGEDTAQSLDLGLPSDSGPHIPLHETAKRVETTASVLLAYLKQLGKQVVEWTKGIGALAIPRAAAAASEVTSRRVLALVRKSASTNALRDGDDWDAVAGSLRLLRAIGSLKQDWEMEKQSAIGVAAGSAASVLETADLVRDSASSRNEALVRLGANGQWAEASALWEVLRDPSLTGAILGVFETANDSQSQDFGALLDGVHLVVYNSMFAGIKRRFAGFGKESVWSEESRGTIDDVSTSAYSSSPLTYATEIADYLMTIPQQLEPYVTDDDESDRYATPESVYAFSVTSRRRNIGAGRSMDGAHARTASDSNDDGSVINRERSDHGEYDGTDKTPASFAGIWIGSLAIGTMELYVEKICAIPRLTLSGARQLATDIEYVCNVLSTLGVAPTEDIDLVRRALECSAEARPFLDMANSVDGPDAKKLVRRLAACRGISISV